MEIVKRKAKFEYHFFQFYEAGLSLVGTEVKSLRTGDANLSDAWCTFENGELYIKSLYIAPYKYGPVNQHESRRNRKLLLKKNELKKLLRRVKEKGQTIVPYRIYFSESGYAKCEIALAQGKKSYDKRESIKRRDVDRDLDRSRLNS
jgi:SsrA-binding protein